MKINLQCKAIHIVHTCVPMCGFQSEGGSGIFHLAFEHTHLVTKV